MENVLIKSVRRRNPAKFHKISNCYTMCICICSGVFGRCALKVHLSNGYARYVCDYRVFQLIFMCWKRHWNCEYACYYEVIMNSWRMLDIDDTSWQSLTFQMLSTALASHSQGRGIRAVAKISQSANWMVTRIELNKITSSTWNWFCRKCVTWKERAIWSTEVRNRCSERFQINRLDQIEFAVLRQIIRLVPPVAFPLDQIYMLNLHRTLDFIY